MNHDTKGSFWYSEGNHTHDESGNNQIPPQLLDDIVAALDINPILTPYELR
jgi:hypothetical protein